MGAVVATELPIVAVAVSITSGAMLMTCTKPGQIDGPQGEPHLRVLLVDFLASYARMTADWAERSDEIGRWDGNDPDPRREHAVARMSKPPRRRAVR